MLKTIAYYLIFGKPLIMYLGILTLLSFLTTAYIGMNVLKPKKGIPFKYHLLIAKISIGLAIVHVVLGLSLYF